MNKKLKKRLTATTASVMGACTLLPALTVIAAPALAGWRQTEGKWYYYNSSGVKAANAWSKDSSGKWFYLGSDGAMVVNGWAMDSSDRWFYLGNDGAMVANGWAQDSSKCWFYLGSDGAMVTSQWVNYKDQSYYLNTGGDMAVNTITPDGSYVKSNGAKLISGNVTELSDGGMHTGDYIITSLGIFGQADATKMTTINGDVIINCPDKAETDIITLQNMKITGTLTVNFGSGTLNMNNVKANIVNIANVGSHSVNAGPGTELGTVNLYDGNGDAHMYAQLGAVIGQLNMYSSGYLETPATSVAASPFRSVAVLGAGSGIPTGTFFGQGNGMFGGGTRPEVRLGGTIAGLTFGTQGSLALRGGTAASVGTLAAQADASISGGVALGNIQLIQHDITVYLGSGPVGTVDILQQATNSRLVIPQGTTVGTLNAGAPSSVEGAGAIGTANIGSSGVIVQPTPAQTNLTAGTTANVGGTAVSSGGTGVGIIPELPTPPSTPPTPPVVPPVTPPSGGGGGGSSSISVSGITIIGEDTAVNGGTLQLGATVIPANATNKTITWSVVNGTGSATIDTNGLLTGTGAGTVTVTAQNAASGVNTTKEITIIIVDKTALTAAITAEVGPLHSTPVYVLNQSDYTASTWTVYKSAITVAILREKNANVVQSAISSAIVAIGTAKAELVFANKAAMDAAAAAANAKVESNYSAASWADFLAARTAALGMPITTNTEMGERTEALNSAVELLKTDKTALTAAITAEIGGNHNLPVYVLTQSDYTTATWTAYANAVSVAILVENHTSANLLQSTIENARAAIGTTKTALVFANQEAMNTAETSANAKVESDYTAASWANFIAARTTALAMPKSTNSEIGARATALNVALSMLKIDKTALSGAITAEVGAAHGTPVYVLTQADYTTATWTAYSNAVTTAIGIEGNINAVQSGIDNATAAIGTTKTALVFANQEAMDTAETSANAKVESDYTAASWVDFIAARTTALAMPKVTNTQIGARATALNSAMALLKTDKTALTGAITAEVGTAHGTPVYALHQADYTTVTWTAYSNAVTTAIGIEGDINAVQSAIDNATAAIGTTKAALVFANQEAMNTAETSANAKVESDYTASSWADFITARTTALAMPATTNTEMGARLKELNDAMALLKTDKTALIAVITSEIGAIHGTPVYALTAGDYTTATWSAYANAVTAAISVEADTNAVQSTIDTAASSIGAKKSALVFVNKAAMDTAVNAANGKVKGEYTAASWTAFDTARTNALALPVATNADMAARTTALNNAIALLVETVPETLSSIEITDFDYATIYATQANIESKTINSTTCPELYTAGPDYANFEGANSKRIIVTDSSGNNITVDLNWKILLRVNDQPATAATVIGSCVESYIQQYFVDKGGAEGLMNRTLWASGSGDKFHIGAFGAGPTGKITITGSGASYLFDTLYAEGTGDDTSKHKTITINDGTTTVTVNLNNSYTNMDNLIANINGQLSSSDVYAVKVDATHFKLVTRTRGVHFTIDGASKAFFFSSFVSQQ